MNGLPPHARPKCNRMMGGVHEKRCSICKEWKPATADYFHRKGRYLHSSCKPCLLPIARATQQAAYAPRVRTVAPRGRKPAERFDAAALCKAMAA